MRRPNHRVLHHLPMRNKMGPSWSFFGLRCCCANLSVPRSIPQFVVILFLSYPIGQWCLHGHSRQSYTFLPFQSPPLLFPPSFLPSSFLPSSLLPSSFLPFNPSFFLMNSTTPWTTTEFLAKYLRRTYDEYDFLGFFGVVFLVKTFCRCKLIYHDGELFFPVSLLQLLVVDRSKPLKRLLMKINVCFWLVWAPRCSSQAYM